VHDAKKWMPCAVYAGDEKRCGNAGKHVVRFGCCISRLGRCTSGPTIVLAVRLLHEAGDGHVVFRLEVAARVVGFGHLMTLTDQVLHFTIKSAM
jgi:hypothetical protein